MSSSYSMVFWFSLYSDFTSYYKVWCPFCPKEQRKQLPKILNNNNHLNCKNKKIIFFFDANQRIKFIKNKIKDRILQRNLI